VERQRRYLNAETNVPELLGHSDYLSAVRRQENKERLFPNCRPTNATVKTPDSVLFSFERSEIALALVGSQRQPFLD
jgi:hypothetical protein